MALWSPSLIPFVIVFGLLLAPGCACLPARDQMRVHVQAQQPPAGFGCKASERCLQWTQPPEQYSNSAPRSGMPGIPTPASTSPTQPSSGSDDACKQEETCPPAVVDKPSSPPAEIPINPNFTSPSQSLPPTRPPPPGEKLRWPKGDVNPSYRNVTPTEGAEQGKKSNSHVASAVGWAFLAAALALQLVLGAYLVHKRRELVRFGTRLEKVPSVSPPPSPAGFAP